MCSPGCTKLATVVRNKMTSNISILFIVFLFACNSQNMSSVGNSRKVDTVFVHDTVYYDRLSNWQDSFGLTHNPSLDSVWKQPMTYYLNNPKCDPVAIDFYFGAFRPSDDYTTAYLLSLATTDNNSLRPFYRWILNKTIIIQDGALGEYTGVPARLYAEKFPAEFFEYMDSDTSGQKYLDWVGSVSYSGYLENEDYRNVKELRNSLIRQMKRNCTKCSMEIRARIDTFANDCFN